MLEKIFTFIKENRLIISGVSIALALAIAVTAMGISNNRKKDDKDSNSSKPTSSVTSSENSSSSEPAESQIVESEDVEGIVSGIETIRNTSEEERLAMGIRGKEYASLNFDVKKLSCKVVEIIENI